MLGLGLWAAAPAAALDPSKPVDKYVLDRWLPGQAIPSSTVRAIAQTPDGYLWLGTQNGLVRFDGARFASFGTRDTPGIGHNHAWVLRVGRDGSLWIGTNRGLSRLKDGNFTLYGKDELPGEILRALLEGRDGSLWIGSEDGGLERWEPSVNGGGYSRGAAYTRKDGLPGASIHALAESPDGSLWIGMDLGLSRLFEGRLETFGNGKGLGSTQVWALLTARDGTVWIGTEGRGLFHWDRGRLEHFGPESGLPDAVVRTLCEDRDGNLWVGTNRGLARLTDGRFSRLGTGEGLSSDLVRSLYEDADGSLWVGFYGGGLNRLRDGEFSSLTARDGLGHDLVWSIAETRDGALWVSTHGGGVSRRKDGKWTTFTAPSELTHNVVRPILEDPDGGLWFGTNGGLSHFRNGRWSRYTKREGLPHDLVGSLHRARDGSLWVGTWGGLSHLVNGTFESFVTPEPARNYIRAIHEDRQGVLWVGSSAGLSRLLEGRLVPYVPREAWPPVAVEAIHEDEDGTLWLGTDGGGLIRKRGEEWTPITSRDGLFDDTVFHVLNDGLGHLWLGGSGGVFRVSHQALKDFVAGRGNRIAVNAFGIAQGMVSAECTGGGAQPGASRGPGGRLWFPTNKGVASVDPKHLGDGASPPRVLIEETRLDGVLLARTGRPEGGPGRGDLEVRYTAINFLSKEIRFRYRLDGLDDSWVSAGERRVAHYGNLPPGTYRFVASASNDGVTWSAPVESAEFRLRPRFYQTVWARALAVVLLVLSGRGLYLLRVRGLARRARELLRMNQALQAEGRERAAAQDKLRESEERYALAARGANDGLWDWDLKSGRVYYSPRWKSMLGHDESAIGDDPEEWLGRIHPDDQARVRADLEAHLSGRSPYFESEHRIGQRGREPIWVLCRGLMVRDGAGQGVRFSGSLTDITRRKRAEAQIQHDAMHDALTGLPNRTLFLDRLGQAIMRRRRRAGYRLAVLFVDLDRFKMVNDSLGHLAGDQLLVSLAARLSVCVRPLDTVARLGGDEFAILVDDIDDELEATHVAERIQRALRQPFDIGGHEVFSTASIGITLGTRLEDRPEDLLRDADTAMYRAKALGRDRHTMFDDAMHARAVAILRLETDLRHALERNELRIHYQPVVALDSGRVVGFEALARWQHPERGLLLPHEFIPLAEETGLIVPIGHRILREACQAARRWQEKAPPGQEAPTVSVNLCVREFSQDDMVTRVRQALAQSGLRPSGLRIEITESMILEDPAGARDRCAALREIGVGIDIDDFGTGYSSLSILRYLPIDALKIDRSFVGGMSEPGGDLAIVRAIVNLAETLGVSVIAEGVETEEQLRQLRALGCARGQGRLFGAAEEERRGPGGANGPYPTARSRGEE